MHTKLEDLTQVFADSESAQGFRGDPVWWREFHRIDLQKCKDPRTREYKNVWFIILEIIFVWVALALFIPMVYLFSNGARASTLSGFHSKFWGMSEKHIATSTDFWEWSRTTLAPKLFSTDPSETPVVSMDGGVSVSFANIEFPSVESPTIVAGTDMVIVGSVRMQQFRVAKRDCPTTFVYSSVSPTCSSEFDRKTNNNKDSYFQNDYPLYLQPAFQWSSSYSGSTLFSNRSGLTYPTDSAGFAVDLPTSRIQTIQLLRDLENNNWIDSRTAAVIVSINAYHPVEDAFVSDRLLFEFTEAGALWSSLQTDVLASSAVMYSRTSADAATQLGLTVMNLIWFSLACAWFIFLVVTVQKRLFTFLWTYLDAVLLILLSVYIYLRSNVYFVMMMWVIGSESVFGQPGEFYPLSAVVPAHQRALVCQTAALALVFFRLNKFAPLASQRVNFAAFHIHTVIGLLVISCYLIVGFSLSYYVSLGYETSVYARWQDSMSAVALSLINVMWVTKTEGSGAFLALLWIFLVYLVIAPLLICLSIEGFTTIAASGPSLFTNPIVVHLRARLDGFRGRVHVTDTSQDTQGIDLDLFPSVIRKRIIAMRRTLRSRVEAEFGKSAVNFDDYKDWVSRNELKRILTEDAFVCKLLGSTNPDEVIANFRGQADLTSSIEKSLERRMITLQKSALDLTAKMSPEISSVSTEVSNLVRVLRNQMDKDLKPLIATIETMNKSMEQLETKVSQMKKSVEAPSKR